VGARLGAARRTTPAVLRVASVAIVLLTLVSGLVAALAVSERQSATSTALQTSEPLLVTAQDIDTSLSDADTTAAASFLQGRFESAGLQSRYQSDVRRASFDLAVAAQEAGTDQSLATSLQTISTELPLYTGLIQDANLYAGQGFYPLGAAYQSEANNLMRSTLLPAAAQVYSTEQGRLQKDQNQAVTPWLAAFALVLLLALVAVLFFTQRSLRRHFNRKWNIALAGATAVVIVLGIWGIIASAHQKDGVTRAVASGSHPVSTFTHARILALRARADDELTLLTRDFDTTFQQDYGTTASTLQSLLATGASSGSLDTRERQALTSAQAAFASYRKLHTQIRLADTSNHVRVAEMLASGSGATLLPAVSSGLNNALSNGIGASQDAFVGGTSGAASDLDGLVWGIAVGSVLVAVLVLVGFQPRIKEYR
jgi:hypothetical protein